MPFLLLARCVPIKVTALMSPLVLEQITDLINSDIRTGAYAQDHAFASAEEVYIGVENNDLYLLTSVSSAGAGVRGGPARPAAG